MAKISGESGKCWYGSSKTISGAAYDTGVVTVTTTTAHGYSAKDQVTISGIVGMTDLNADFTIASAPTATTFTVSLTTAQSYTSGGTVRRIQYITDWSLDTEAATQEITDSSSGGVREHQGNGFTGWSGTIAGFVEGEINTLVKGTSLSLRLDLSTGTEYYSGTAYITSEVNTLTVAGTDAVKVEYSFQGTDELTEPT